MKGALLALVLFPVLPCLWDSDTLETELRGLPDAEALVVTGRWHRHGKAYYEKRLRDLPPRLEAVPPDYDAFDDFAVAQERLGDPDAAIATMDRKAKALEAHPHPDHLYRMYANRGTFHAHAGRYDEALADLGKALELNPDAHFGRERYQVDLIRYAKAAKAEPELWARCNFLQFATPPYTGDPPASNPPMYFYSPKHSSKEALDAMAGMLRFGGKEGAEIYRAYGELQRRHEHRNLHLAWWALHRAIDRGHPAAGNLRTAIAGIEKHWAEAGMSSPPTESTWLAMKVSGEKWLAAFQAAEEASIARGEDPGEDAVLRKLLEVADREAGPPPAATTFSPANLFSERNLPFVIPPIAGIVILALISWDRRRRARKAAESAAAG